MPVPDAWKTDDCQSSYFQSNDLTFHSGLNTKQLRLIPTSSMASLFYQNANFLTRRFSDTKFMYYATESQYACAYRTSLRYHAHKDWLTKVLFIVHEGNLCSGLTNQLAEPVRVSQDWWALDGLRLQSRGSVQTSLTLSELGLLEHRSHTRSTIYQHCLSCTKLVF